MAVKKNQGSLHDEVVEQLHFSTTPLVKPKGHSWDLDEQIGKTNGRVNIRRIAVTRELNWMLPSILKRWKDLATLIMIESETTTSALSRR